MARINYPTRFLNQVELFTDVKAKDTADGSSSVIKPFLTEEGIDLNSVELIVNKAVDADKLAKKLSKESEELMAERNKLFDVVFDDHRSCVQFLKKLYISNINKLGDWGVTIDNNSRVVYPPDFLSKVQTVNTFIDKHLSFPAGSSPLQPFLTENEIDLTANQNKANLAKTSNDSSDQKAKDKELQNELRDNNMDEIMSHLRGIGGFLVALYPENPRKAGEWGYTIDSAKQEDKDRTIEIGASAVKTIYNLVPGSMVINLGDTELSIFPGKETNGDATKLPAGQTFVVARKYGTSTFKNDSNTQKGTVEVTVNG